MLKLEFEFTCTTSLIFFYFLSFYNFEILYNDLKWISHSSSVPTDRWLIPHAQQLSSFGRIFLKVHCCFCFLLYFCLKGAMYLLEQTKSDQILAIFSKFKLSSHSIFYLINLRNYNASQSCGQLKTVSVHDDVTLTNINFDDNFLHHKIVTRFYFKPAWRSH